MTEMKQALRKLLTETETALTAANKRVESQRELMHLAWIELEMVSPNAEITDKLFEALK